MSEIAKVDIKRKRGDTKDFKINLTQKKVIYPLAGCSSKLSVSALKAPTTDDYIFQSIGIVNDTEGSITFSFAAEDVDHLGTFYYDVEIIDGDGKIATILEGKWSFSQDITK